MIIFFLYHRNVDSRLMGFAVDWNKVTLKTIDHLPSAGVDFVWNKKVCSTKVEIGDKDGMLISLDNTIAGALKLSSYLARSSGVNSSCGNFFASNPDIILLETMLPSNSEKNSLVSLPQLYHFFFLSIAYFKLLYNLHNKLQLT